MNKLRHTVRVSTRGMTLVEMLVYVALLVAVLVVIVNSLIVVMGAYRTLTATRDVHASAVASMDRLAFDLRRALRVDTSASAFDTHPGVLAVVVDEGGAEHTYTYSLSGEALALARDGVSQGFLSRATSTAITSLVFRHLNDGAAQAVRIEMTIEADGGKGTTTASFFDTFTLRNPQ